MINASSFLFLITLMLWYNTAYFSLFFGFICWGCSSRSVLYCDRIHITPKFVSHVSYIQTFFRYLSPCSPLCICRFVTSHCTLLLFRSIFLSFSRFLFCLSVFFCISSTTPQQEDFNLGLTIVVYKHHFCVCRCKWGGAAPGNSAKAVVIRVVFWATFFFFFFKLRQRSTGTSSNFYSSWQLVGLSIALMPVLF